MVAAIERTADPALDQFFAAYADIRASFDPLAAVGYGTVTLRQPSDVPEWLRLAGAEALLGYLLRGYATCRHDPDRRTPSVVCAASWRPELIACAVCAPDLFRGPRQPQCDRCGSDVAVTPSLQRPCCRRKGAPDRRRSGP
jgi:hypothetical protein